MTPRNLLLFLCCLYGAFLCAETRTLEISLEDCRQLVILQNMEISAQKLGYDAARSLYQGEKQAMWEPVLVLGLDEVSNERENNQEQFISQGVEDFAERNRIYRVAVEQPLVTGGQVQLGYTLRDLKNNLREQRDLEGPDREYEGFMGLVFTQPLLKSGGFQIGLSLLRMARAESEAVFQEWRRQIMQTLGGAEAGYWDLQIAQRRVELREASVRVAEKILEDNRARLDAGRTTEMEVQQAEAGLALRRTQLLEARQNRVETASRLKTFFSESIERGGYDLRVTDVPALRDQEVDLERMFTEALSLHPDLLLRQHRLEQDRIRLTYSKNQALPQLDLQASYGYNGLGESASEAYDKVQESDFVSWSVGLQLRFPMGGGRRSLHELKASRLRSEQAEIGLEGTRIALANSLATNARRMSNNTEQARNYQQVASLNQVLLDTELARLEAGKSDSRKVLDTEEKLTEALDAEATSLTRCMVAQLEFELSTGALLKNRGLDPMTNPLLMDDPAADAAPLVEEIPRETPPVPDQPALDQPVPRQSAIAPEPIHVSKTEASTVRTVPIRIIMNEAPNTPVASERQKSDVAEEIPPDRLSFLHQPVQRKAPAAPESKDDPHPSAPSTGTEPVRIPLNGRP